MSGSRGLEAAARIRHAAAAGGADTETGAELAERGRAVFDCDSDVLVGDRMAMTDVHGVPVDPCLRIPGCE